MVATYRWQFCCPLCNSREPKHKGHLLSVGLGSKPPPREWYSEKGCGEIQLCSRGFYHVGYTTVIPQSMIELVKDYLTEHHNQLVKSLKAVIGKDVGLDTLFQMEGKQGDFVIFEGRDGQKHLLSRSQATILKNLALQAKMADIAEKKRMGIVGKCKYRSEPQAKYMRAWNAYYIARGTVVQGDNVALVDKKNRVITESLCKLDALKSTSYKLRKGKLTRTEAVDIFAQDGQSKTPSEAYY
jgi:hypothetical protein